MRRKGFSLIELLIVVAIIAALVGVAVPFFQDNLQQAQQTKARQDLDTIRSAISLHDAQNRPLVGTSLDPLIGRYLQEVPRDPWGNDYLLDANVGIVISFGADAQAGGSGGDQDIYFFYKPALRISRAQYDGSWGVPYARGNRPRVVLTMTKPFVQAGNDHDDFTEFFCLIVNTRDPDTLTGDFADGDWQITLDDLQTAHGQEWIQAATLHDPASGVYVIQQTTEQGAGMTGDSQPWTPTMAVNFDISWDASGATDLHAFGIEESWIEGGPLDDAIYGAAVQNLYDGGGTGAYRRLPEPIPVFASGVTVYNRGVSLERF